MICSHLFHPLLQALDSQSLKWSVWLVAGGWFLSWTRCPVPWTFAPIDPTCSHTETNPPVPTSPFPSLKAFASQQSQWKHAWLTFQLEMNWKHRPELAMLESQWHCSELKHPPMAQAANTPRQNDIQLNSSRSRPHQEIQHTFNDSHNPPKATQTNPKSTLHQDAGSGSTLRAWKPDHAGWDESVTCHSSIKCESISRISTNLWDETTCIKETRASLKTAPLLHESLIAPGRWFSCFIYFIIFQYISYMFMVLWTLLPLWIGQINSVWDDVQKFPLPCCSIPQCMWMHVVLSSVCDCCRSGLAAWLSTPSSCRCIFHMSGPPTRTINWNHDWRSYVTLTPSTTKYQPLL